MGAAPVIDHTAVEHLNGLERVNTAPRGRSSRSSQPRHLHAVSTPVSDAGHEGLELIFSETARNRPEMPHEAPAAVRADEATGRMRITARGRRVLLGLSAATLALGLIFVGGGAASTTEQPIRVTVEPGQTLSEIAAEHRPDVSIRTGMTRIQQANQMNTDQIYGGQVLVIPPVD